MQLLQDKGYNAKRQRYHEVEKIGLDLHRVRYRAGIDRKMLTKALGDEEQPWIANGHRCACCAPSDMQGWGAQCDPDVTQM